MDPKKKFRLFRTNKNFCVVPWTNFEIFTNGNIRTCSVGKEIFGNVNETDIMEILTKNPTLKRIKTNMLNDRPDSNCIECQHRSITDENFSYLRDHYNPKIVKEDVDYENAEKFQEKVSTLKEAYFKTGKFEAVSDDTTVASSDTDPLSTDEVQNATPEMSGYTAAISKFAKLDD